MKITQIGLTPEYPFVIRDGNVYSSTLCRNGTWVRAPHYRDVKAFRTREAAEKYKYAKYSPFCVVAKVM